MGSAGLGQLRQRRGRREFDQRHALTVDDERRLAARLGPAPVVLEQRRDQRGQIVDQPFAQQLLFQQILGELGERRARLPLRQRLEYDLGRRRIPSLALGARLVLPAPLGLDFFVAFLVLRL